MEIEREVEALATMSPAQLREQWQRLAGDPVPKVSANMLRFAVAYELQARRLGALSRKTRRQLELVGNGRRPNIATPSGTRLAREWNGTVHIVTVTESGRFLWNDREWRSLSEVARAITGTRWSGPAFFGLRQKRAA